MTEGKDTHRYRVDADTTRVAIDKLREAKALLKAVGAFRAEERVRLAITSAEGALRHRECKIVRAQLSRGGGW